MDGGFQQNTFVFIMIIGILLMLALALAFVLYVNFSQKKLMTEQMRNQEQAYEHQEALLHSTILTQEKERKRIARELHDEIGSKLNVILLGMHRLKGESKKSEPVTAIANEMNSLIRTTIQTTRRISHDLLPPTLEDFGLIETIKELQGNFRRAGSDLISLELTEEEGYIADKMVELNLFRVIQELVNNSIKHGAASAIKIDLSVKPNWISLAYVDNGKGLDLSQWNRKKGLGWKNIESRLHMIDATYGLQSAVGEGFKMKINVQQN